MQAAPGVSLLDRVTGLLTRRNNGLRNWLRSTRVWMCGRFTREFWIKLCDHAAHDHRVIRNCAQNSRACGVCRYPHSEDCYFSPDKQTCAALEDVIQAAEQAAREQGALLFVGEYGGAG